MRSRKLAALQQTLQRPRVHGAPEGELLLVGWGSTRGAIPTRWNVSGWPTIYVLDHNGVIRAKNVRNKPLAGVDPTVSEHGVQYELSQHGEVVGGCVLVCLSVWKS